MLFRSLSYHLYLNRIFSHKNFSNGAPQSSYYGMFFSRYDFSCFPCGPYNYIKDNIGQNKEKLRNDCYLKLPEARKLYLLTIPLTGDRKESEIEHLFSKEVLEMEIKGKKFGLCKQGEEGEYYDKKDFARYVSSNYQNIDFKNFEPVLSAIDAVMANPEDNDSYT